MRILVTETLGEGGLALLREHAEVDVREGLSAEELVRAVGEYEGLVIRSRTKVTGEVLAAGRKLQVVGRAGVGVDNIDVPTATHRGITVVNAPTGNNNAVAEHTVALILALARRLYPAICSLKEGRWEKSALQGIEVKGRTLGLVGLGRIGMLVASKAKALEMRVVAYDPYVSRERAASRGIELMTLHELLANADFVSVHTPLTPKTKGLIGPDQFAMMKPTAYVVNCARGGIIDEAALQTALAKGTIAGAALDVFAAEPAVDNPVVDCDSAIATPHLGGSTAEAQENVGLDVAQAVIDVLEGRVPSSPVNVPYLPPRAVEFLRPYIDLAQRLGSFFVQWRDGLASRLELVFEGEICDYDTRLLTSAFLAGLLAPATEEPVNLVNAPHIAQERGLEISEMRRERRQHFDSLILARFPKADGPQDIAGAMVQGEPHLVQLDGQRINCVVQGRMLADLHNDRPGIVGSIGQILGNSNINISFVQMSRASRGGDSIMVLGLDSEVPDEALPQCEAVDNVRRVRRVTLPPFDGYVNGHH